MIAALSLYFVLVYPLFSWLHDNPSFGSLAAVQIVLCCLLGVFFGPISTAVAEQFVARSRSTGLGIAYNLAVMIWRFRAVLRNLADRGDRITNSAVVLRDVRRRDWHCCDFFPC